MRVHFKVQKVLLDKVYKAGMYEIADKAAYTRAFRDMVFSGAVVILPRDEIAQKSQAAKDAHAVKKAVKQSMAAKDDKILAIAKAKLGMPRSKKIVG